MSKSSNAAGRWLPRLPDGVTLRFDRADDMWCISVPARTIMPDDITVEILKRCDGRTSVDTIVDELAQVFSADRQQVKQDVIAVLDDMRERGVVEI